MEWLLDDLIKYGVKFGVALLILVGGFWLSNLIAGFVKRRMIKRRVDPSIVSFITPIISILLKLMVVLSSINVVGIQITSFAAVLGGLAVGVGLALQGSLSNFAGGMLIITFKPFKVGDYIESLGHGGTVSAISILYTTIITPNNQEVILPNASLLNNPVKNFSSQSTRRLDINVGIAYDDDFEKVRVILMKMLENEPAILKNEPITVEVLEFANSSVNLAIRGFVKTEDYWNVYFKMYKETKRLFDENGITIPFPQTDLHIVRK